MKKITNFYENINEKKLPTFNENITNFYLQKCF